MEQTSLESVNKNVLELRDMIGQIQEILIEDELELSDEVIQEIEESRGKHESELITFEDIKKEFDEA